MLSTQVASATNSLLSTLPDKDREQLLANCELIKLILADELYHAGEVIDYAYFPIESFISLVTHIDNSASLEVGLVGNEGMLGIALLLGVSFSPFTALVQGAGLAWRISSALFLNELERSPALRQILKRYLYVSVSQLAQTAACTRFHLVEARLARWLLMTHDRAHANTFHVTHLFLAYILGVRRVGITKAAYSLQKRKLISYHRGNIIILDRIGLESVSCQCYEADKKIYNRILNTPKF